MAGIDLEIRENVPLAPLTTLGVGGNARFFVAARDVAGVEQAVAFARDRGLELFVLGGGSNLVISDRGFNGLVLQIAIDGIDELPKGESNDARDEARHEKGETTGAEKERLRVRAPEGQRAITQRFQRFETGEHGSSPAGTTECGSELSHEQVVLHTGAGVSWDKFVAFCVDRGYSGVECLSGIPGSVGGTPVQNVGAYGQEVSETIVSALAYDVAERQVRELQNSECGFRYISSIFNSSQRGRYIILSVTYGLRADAAPVLRYADLQKYFAVRNGKPSLADVRDAVLKIRASKGMVIAPNDPDSRSAGSFFKNPVLSEEQYAQLEHKASARGLRVPSYPALAQQSKVSAAWLVENSGFHKGYTKGAVGISSKHALAIVNCGGARAADVVALRDEIQAKVQQTWGVKLEPEPVFVGS